MKPRLRFSIHVVVRLVPMASAQHDPVITDINDAAGKRQCALFLLRKGRNCRMQATKGSLYCGEHLILDKNVII